MTTAQVADADVQHAILFRRLVECSRDGVALIDGGGLLQYVSPRTTQMLGYGAGEMEGKSLYAFLDRLHSEKDFPGTGIELATVNALRPRSG